jgi:hypothetical protein
MRMANELNVPCGRRPTHGQAAQKQKWSKVAEWTCSIFCCLTGFGIPAVAGIGGRGKRIRTSGPCVPNAVLYQAELFPDAFAFNDLQASTVFKVVALSIICPEGTGLWHQYGKGAKGGRLA